MPVEQPNLQANPVRLEQNVTVCSHKGDGEYFLFFNNSTDTTYQDGEPFVSGDAVCIAQGRILPKTSGPVMTNFLVHALMDPDYSGGNINQGSLIYLDTDLADSDNPIGYVTSVEPDNGFVLGRAVVPPGATSIVAAGNGSTHVYVRSSPVDFATFAPAPAPGPGPG